MPRGAAHAQIHRLFAVGTTASLPEGKLLDRFLDDGDEAAFEAIVAAHGPMVLGVCRGMLADRQSADDAFQATFLILVQKARSIARRDLLGPWLHGVAHKVASRSRSKSYREQTSATLDETPCTPAADDLDRRERSRLLHEELAALPAKYRSPVVLCHLEGLTHDEAASRLGWPVGTVRGRLSRARDQLRVKLTRRGAAPAVGAIAAAMAAESRAAVPSTLMNQTLKLALQHATAKSGAALAASAAVALSREVSMSMMFTPAKLAATGLVAATLATGAAVWALQTDGPAAKPDATSDPLAATKPTADPARSPLAADRPGQPIDPTDALHRLTEPHSTLDLSGRDGSGLVNVHSGMSTLNTKQYLVKTSQEVEAGLAALAKEVSDLEARLDYARTGMARLKALKEALHFEPINGDQPTLVMPGSPQPPSSKLHAPGTPAPPEPSRPPALNPPIAPASDPGLSVEPSGPTKSKQTTYLPRSISASENGGPANVGPAPTPVPIPSAEVRPLRGVKVGQTIRIKVLETLPGRPLHDTLCTVRSDGTISLGYYGDIQVVGLDRREIKRNLIVHLRYYLSDKALGLVEQDPTKSGSWRPVAGAIEDNEYVSVDDEPGDAPAARRLEELERKLDALQRASGSPKDSELELRPPARSEPGPKVK